MSDFNYQLPDAKQYFNALLTYLSNSNADHHSIFEAIKEGSCEFYSESSFSNRRWNAYYTEVHISVPADKMFLINEKLIQLLTKACDLMMPKISGYDVMDVKVVPMFVTTGKTLTDQLNEVLQVLPIDSFKILPDDIVEKGKDMAEVYTYLYYVENSLRIFVEEVCKRTHGDDYFDKIIVSREITKAIDRRVNEEVKHKWMRVRGSSKIFYLDFVDLSSLIINNWDLFKSYFPDQQWLNVKVGDMARCRNYVAHNSYIDLLERDVLKASFSQILRQISRVEQNPVLPNI